MIIIYKGIELELVHNPIDASGLYKFVVHGHTHQHNKDFTHKHGIKYFNANTELTKYRPKLLSEIIGELKK
jgi:calcineurin-like phosphoesterase family protein